MKDKREIEIGDYITTDSVGAGEKLLKVESIRVVDDVKKYYVGGEGVQGVHAVSEDDVVDHATPEEYKKYLESLKGEVDSEPATEETTPVAPVTEQTDEPTIPVATDATEPVAPVTDAKTDPEPAAPGVAIQPAAQQQQGNKNQNNKRRV